MLKFIEIPIIKKNRVVYMRVRIYMYRIMKF